MGDKPPYPEIENNHEESPLGWDIPYFLARELVIIAREFHFTPEQWLDTDANVRRAMLKYLRLESEAVTDWQKKKSNTKSE